MKTSKIFGTFYLLPFESLVVSFLVLVLAPKASLAGLPGDSLAIRQLKDMDYCYYIIIITHKLLN